MNSLNEINFHNCGVEIEYEYRTDCSQHGCNDDGGICRCGEIYNDRITEVDINAIVNRIYDKYYDIKKTLADKRNATISEVLSGVGKDVNIYCIDRIAKNFKLWEFDYYEINKAGGYYGEEINGVLLHENIAKKVLNEIEYVNELTSLNDKIEYLIMKEYERILPELVGCDYQVMTVDKEDIVFGSIPHHNKVKGKSLEFYSDDVYDKIRGIAIKDGDKYRLIDGYHRTHTTKRPKVRLIVASKKP